ncbi:hypothetical protein [Rahnella aquatilis]|uniref:hypothetical protein n=1 Tax=Rahnella aquatilis TaxID=34038 RepID=UPI00365C4476
MISDRKRIFQGWKIIVLPLIPTVFILLFILHGFSVKKDRAVFPVNIPCRGNMIVEARYDNQSAKLVSTLYFSFLDNHKILVSLSGTGYLYDEKGNITQRKTLLRNIYYDYIHESTHSSTYSLTSSQINIDSVDNMDWQISSLLLLNSFFLTGHTDTLALKKYDDNTLLIESNQSPVALCVFKKMF